MRSSQTRHGGVVTVRERNIVHHPFQRAIGWAAGHSVATRILVGATAVVGFALFVAGAYFSLEQTAEIDRVFEKQNQSLVDSLAAFSVEQLVVFDYPAVEYAIGVAGLRNDSVRYIEVRHGEQRVATYGNPGAEGQRFDAEILRAEGSARRLGQISMVFSTHERDALKIGVLRNNLITLLLIFVVMGISLRWLLRRAVILPIEQLTARTEEAMAKALPDVPLRRDRDLGADEIRMLDQRFRDLLEGLRARDEARDIAERALIRYRENLELLVEDRTHELRLAREEAERLNRVKSEFLAAASHDLRQPLQAINLFHTVLKSTRLDDEQRAIVHSLSLALTSLGDLLNALLDLSKLDSGRVKPAIEPMLATDLLQRLNVEFSPLAHEKGLRFKLFFPFADLYLMSDPKLLLSLLNNLVSNAIKYTDRGGVLVSVRQRGRQALLQVWDTGIGIDEKDIGKIYDEYFQISNPQRDRTKGLGLGLSIVRRLARLLGAEVSCRSRVGQGTVFSVALPLLSGQGRTQAVPVLSRGLPDDAFECFRGRQVVLVEDDAMLRDAMSSALAARGMTVRAFSSAEEVLLADDLRGVRYFLSDYRLPGRDGLALFAELQQRLGRRINAVLLTGDTSPERIRTAETSGWPVLFKPVDLERVLGLWYCNQIGQ